MDYKFPVIEHIDQVRAAIQDYPEFIIADRDFMLVVNYNVGLENTFGRADDLDAQIRRECRGLKFSKSTGRILARPYHKFFNLNERDETQVSSLDIQRPNRILEKLDGSMIHAVPVGREFRFCTKMGITDVSMGAENFVCQNSNIYRLVRDLHEQGFTVIFEWCSPKQRIVIDYRHDQLIITAVRNIITGEYWSYDRLLALGQEYSVPVVATLAQGINDLNSLVNYIRGLENLEGYVIRWDSGHMVKIKADQYVLLHRTKDQIRLEKNVIDIIINEKSDDLRPLLDREDLEKFVLFEQKFWNGLGQVCDQINDVYQQGAVYQSRRDFAVEFVQKQPQHLRPLLYELRNGYDVRSVVVDTIKNNLSTQIRIDSVRWLWGNSSWTSSFNYNEDQ